jgi:chromosome segregation ATPase
MPLGLWKSKWEIHREDVEEYRVDMAEYRIDMAEYRADVERYRQDTERYRADTDRFHENTERYWVETERRWAEYREERERHREEAESQWAEYREERARVDAEFAAMRRRSDELREECRRDIKAAMELVGDQLLAMRKELHENTDAVRAQTEAILKLVDRFEAWEGRMFPEG